MNPSSSVTRVAGTTSIGAPLRHLAASKRGGVAVAGIIRGQLAAVNPFRRVPLGLNEPVTCGVDHFTWRSRNCRPEVFYRLDADRPCQSCQPGGAPGRTGLERDTDEQFRGPVVAPERLPDSSLT